jgi:hypothetical protein
MYSSRYGMRRGGRRSWLELWRKEILLIFMMTDLLQWNVI